MHLHDQAQHIRPCQCTATLSNSLTRTAAFLTRVATIIKRQSTYKPSESFHEDYMSQHGGWPGRHRPLPPTALHAGSVECPDGVGRQQCQVGIGGSALSVPLEHDHPSLPTVLYVTVASRELI